MGTLFRGLLLNKKGVEKNTIIYNWIINIKIFINTYFGSQLPFPNDNGYNSTVLFLSNVCFSFLADILKINHMHY